jgi:hypothetical protein
MYLKIMLNYHLFQKFQLIKHNKFNYLINSSTKLLLEYSKSQKVLLLLLLFFGWASSPNKCIESIWSDDQMG